MKARDDMASDVITVGPELDVKAVANTLVANGISAAPVVAIEWHRASPKQSTLLAILRSRPGGSSEMIFRGIP